MGGVIKNPNGYYEGRTKEQGYQGEIDQVSIAKH
jgi:hypothetical protein